MTFTPTTKRLAVELVLPVFTIYRSVAAGIRALNFPHSRRMLLPTAPPPRTKKPECDKGM